MRPSVTEHVTIHSKSLCKNIERASGGANNMRPISWGHKWKRSIRCYKLRETSGILLKIEALWNTLTDNLINTLATRKRTHLIIFFQKKRSSKRASICFPEDRNEKAKHDVTLFNFT